MDDELALMCAGVRIRETTDLAEGWLWLEPNGDPVLLVDSGLTHARRCRALRWALDRLRRAR